jgi:hypothetical protein
VTSRAPRSFPCALVLGLQVASGDLDLRADLPLVHEQVLDLSLLGGAVAVLVLLEERLEVLVGGVERRLDLGRGNLDVLDGRLVVARGELPLQVLVGTSTDALTSEPYFWRRSPSRTSSSNRSGV